MIKVYSYKRSGTHLLMSLLWKNFKFKKDTIKIGDCGFDWSGEKVENGDAIIPWGELFGSHKLPNKIEFSLNNSVYIYRDGRDTLVSLYNARKIEEDFNKWINESLIKNWYNHVVSWLDTGIVNVTFYGLNNKINNELKKIEDEFGLKRKNKNFKKMDKLIGWSPNKGKTGSYKEYWNFENLRMFDRITNSFRIKK